MLKLAAYTVAGVVTTLGIAWGGREENNAMRYTEWQGPADSNSTGLPAGAILRVRKSNSWRRNIFVTDGGFIRRPGEQEPAWPPNRAAIATACRDNSYANRIEKRFPPDGYEHCVSLASDFRGFPFLCVWAWEDYLQYDGVPRESVPRTTYFSVSDALGWEFDGRWSLPVTPLWPGLVANVAIWGLAWYGLLFIPLRLLPWSAASRKRRGRCVVCGYDLTGAVGRCPECGESTAGTAQAVK